MERGEWRMENAPRDSCLWVVEREVHAASSTYAWSICGSVWL
jgi:hypothetical protein